MIFFFIIFNLVECIQIFPVSGPEDGGTLIEITGEIFVPAADLSCVFLSGTANAVFYNSSHIECFSPKGTGKTNLTVSGVSSFTFDSFTYYKPLNVLSISPLNGSDLEYHLITITLSEFLLTDNWSLKIHKYTVPCTSNLTCTIPPLPVLQNLNPTNSSSFPILLSRNSQQFEDSGYEFHYLLSSYQEINLFDASPTHGPKSGKTQVNISFSQEIEIVDPLCKFGESTITGFNVYKFGFFCLTPEGFGKIKVSISVNGIDFSQIGKEFVYDNFTLFNYYPDQGSISGGTNVVVQGDFMPYPTITCKFGLAVLTGSLSINEYLTCTAPSGSLGSVIFSISLNQQDYYEIGTYFYRPKETIVSILPVSGPNHGGTLIAFSLTYLNNTQNAYCRIGTSYKTKMSSNFTCMVPSVTIVSSPVKIYVSSNDFDYESFATYTYYTRTTLTAISPNFVTDTLVNRTYNITGTGFLNTGVIKVTMQGILYNGNFVSSTLINFTAFDQLAVGRTNVSVAINGQNFSPSQVYFEVFKESILRSVNPNFGFIKGGIRLNLIGINFVYSETVFCRFDTADVQGTWLSETTATCLNPTQTSTRTVQVSVSFNSR